MTSYRLGLLTRFEDKCYYRRRDLKGKKKPQEPKKLDRLSPYIETAQNYYMNWIKEGDYKLSYFFYE